jgi:hypothetical protein
VDCEQLFESLEISRDHAEALALYNRESERFGLRVPSHPFLRSFAAIATQNLCSISGELQDILQARRMDA